MTARAVGVDDRGGDPTVVRASRNEKPLAVRRPRRAATRRRGEPHHVVAVLVGRVDRPCPVGTVPRNLPIHTKRGRPRRKRDHNEREYDARKHDDLAPRVSAQDSPDGFTPPIFRQGTDAHFGERSATPSERSQFSVRSTELACRGERGRRTPRRRLRSGHSLPIAERHRTAPESPRSPPRRSAE